MMRRERLIRRIKECLENPITASEERKLRKMLERAEAEAPEETIQPTHSSWEGQDM